MRFVRVDHAKAILTAVCEDAIGSAIPIAWGQINIPRPKRPYVSLRILSGPAQIGTFADPISIRCAPTQVDLVVPLGGTRTYKFRLNGIPFAVEGTDSDSIQVIRDKLLALVQPSATRDLITAVASSTDTIEFTPNVPGAIFSVESVNVLTVAPTGEVVVEDAIGRRKIIVSCHFVDEVDPDGVHIEEDGAMLLAGQCYDNLNNPLMGELMLDNHVTILPISDPTNIASPIEPGGAKFETRYNFDVEMMISSRITVPRGIIETVEGTILGQTFTLDLTT